MIVLLTFALFFLIMNMAWGKVQVPLKEGLSSAMPVNSSVNVTRTLDQTTSAGFMFDKLLPFIIIGLFAFVLIMVGGIIRHPIMIFVGIIILAVIILLATIFSNAYNSISSTDEFSSTKTQMPIQDKFMQYLPMILFVMAIAIVGGIMWRSSSGGQVGL
jgi:hypothetical protein